MPDLKSPEGLRSYFFKDDHPEAAEIEYLTRIVDPNRRYVFFDIGSNMGLYSFHMNRALKNSRLFCVEPHPVVFRHLENGTAQWDGDRGNRVTCINKAVADKPGKVSFFSSPDLTVGSILSDTEPSREHGHGETIEVDCTTLDELVEQADPTPDETVLCKIDVEGGEWRVLQGGTRTLERPDLQIFIEIHRWGDAELGKRPRDVCHLLLGRGFAFELVGTHWMFRRTGAAGRLGSLARHYWRFLLQLKGRRYLAELLGREGA